MKIVTLVKIKLNHLPPPNRAITRLKECIDKEPETVRQIVIEAAKECGETKTLDNLEPRDRDWNKISFDINSGSTFNYHPYAECEFITPALKIDGRYFKAEEILP